MVISCGYFSRGCRLPAPRSERMVGAKREVEVMRAGQPLGRGHVASAPSAHDMAQRLPRSTRRTAASFPAARDFVASVAVVRSLVPGPSPAVPPSAMLSARRGRGGKGHRCVNPGLVEVGGFCCPVPPGPRLHCLRSESERLMIVIGTCSFGPMTAEPCRAKSEPLPRVSSLFRPLCPARPSTPCLLELAGHRRIGGGAGYCPRVHNALFHAPFIAIAGKPAETDIGCPGPQRL